MTGATEGGDDAGATAGGRGADPATWALPADAAVAAGGVSTGADAPGGERPGAVAAGAGETAETASGSGTRLDTGIPALDKAIGALPVDEQLIEERPEILVGGAFVAGFLLARLLKAVGGS